MCIQNSVIVLVILLGMPGGCREASQGGRHPRRRFVCGGRFLEVREREPQMRRVVKISVGDLAALERAPKRGITHSRRSVSRPRRQRDVDDGT